VNWIIILGLLAIAGLAYSIYGSSYNDLADNVGVGSIMVLVVCAVLLFASGVIVWDFAPAMKRLQETRAAVAVLPCESSFSASKVYGDAVEWNQEVQSNRVWNSRWLADPFIADGWDTVTVITIPSCR